MNKKLILFGVAFLLICIELSGCIGGTSIKDILEHPNNYLDEEVTLIASYGGRMHSYTEGFEFGTIYQKKFFSDEIEATLVIAIPEEIYITELFQFGEYKFTGIVKSANEVGFLDLVTPVYIEVSEIEPT